MDWDTDERAVRNCCDDANDCGDDGEVNIVYFVVSR